MKQLIYVITSPDPQLVAQFIKEKSFQKTPLIINTFDLSPEETILGEVFNVSFDALEEEYSGCTCCVPSNEWVSTFAKVISYNETVGHSLTPIVVAIDPRVDLKRWLTLMRSTDYLMRYFEIKVIWTALNGDEDHLTSDYLRQLGYVQYGWIHKTLDEQLKQKLLQYQPLLIFNSGKELDTFYRLQSYQEMIDQNPNAKLEAIYYENNEECSIETFEKWLDHLTYTYGDQLMSFTLYFPSDYFDQALLIEGNHKHYDYTLTKKIYSDRKIQGVFIGEDIKDENLFFLLNKHSERRTCMKNYTLFAKEKLTVSKEPPYDPFMCFVRENHIAKKATGQGKLSGYVFSAKDVFTVKGSTFGNGHPEYLKWNKPDAFTATGIEVLLDHGADLVGKTVCDELCCSISGENWHYGSPLNPHDVRRYTGGSSSGSCASVAGDLVDFSIGSDCLGSVRVPASYTNLYGMRPNIAPCR